MSALRPPAQARVKIGGGELPEELAATLREVSVEDELGHFAMFTLHFATPRALDLLEAEGPFAFGAPVEIGLGYGDALAPPATALEVTTVELSLSEGELPGLVVRGYNRGHRLDRSDVTRTWKEATIGAIAQEIGEKYGLVASVSGLLPNVADKILNEAQLATTDLAFLKRLGETYGFVVTVEGLELRLRPPAARESEPIPLSVEREIIAFGATMTTRGQVDKVTVWSNDAGFAPVMASALAAPGSGGSASAEAFGAAERILVSRTQLDQEQAGDIAAAELRRRELEFVTCSATCFGDPTLRAGSSVELLHLARFSGAYEVTRATHSLSERAGYRTELVMRRDVR